MRLGGLMVGAGYMGREDKTGAVAGLNSLVIIISAQIFYGVLFPLNDLSSAQMRVIPGLLLGAMSLTSTGERTQEMDPLCGFDAYGQWICIRQWQDIKISGTALTPVFGALLRAGPPYVQALLGAWVTPTSEVQVTRVVWVCNEIEKCNKVVEAGTARLPLGGFVWGWLLGVSLNF